MSVQESNNYEKMSALLDEITHWPTYYPAALTGDEVVHEMIAH